MSEPDPETDRRSIETGDLNGQVNQGAASVTHRDLRNCGWLLKRAASRIFWNYVVVLFET
jgi:hypothetical protein